MLLLFHPEGLRLQSLTTFPFCVRGEGEKAVLRDCGIFWVSSLIFLGNRCWYMHLQITMCSPAWKQVRRIVLFCWPFNCWILLLHRPSGPTQQSLLGHIKRSNRPRNKWNTTYGEVNGLQDHASNILQAKTLSGQLRGTTRHIWVYQTGSCTHS